MSIKSVFEQLYLERCDYVDGHYKPNFWNPQTVTEEPFCLFGDEDMEVNTDWNCQEVILKLIAAGLELELEVGEFVKEATQKDLPQDDYVKKLLMTNVADEAKHFKGFVSAAESYPIPQSYKQEAESFRHAWQELAETEHPLLIAMAMEIGVFLPYLGCSRLFGGKSLATLSRKIAEDEFRHVITNRTVLDTMNYNTWKLPVQVQNLVEASLDWAICDLQIPEADCGEKFDLDFVLRASQELIETGQAVDFNDVILVSDHSLPFELSNASQYDRVLA